MSDDSDDDEYDPPPTPPPARLNPHARTRNLAKQGGKTSRVGVGSDLGLIRDESQFTLGNVTKLGVTVFGNRTIRLCFMQAEAALAANELVDMPAGERRDKLQARLFKMYDHISRLESQLHESAERIVILLKQRGHEVGELGEALPAEAKVLLEDAAAENAAPKPRDVKFVKPRGPTLRNTPGAASAHIDRGGGAAYPFKRSAPVTANEQFRAADPSEAAGA